MLDRSLSGSAQLVYSTLIGGDDNDDVIGVSVDAAGVMTIAGDTASSDFPTTTGAYDETFNGVNDGFVCRLDPSRSGAQQLIYSTYIGGSDTAGAGGFDSVNGLVVDEAGIVTIAGKTDSDDFPITAGSYGTRRAGMADLFAAQLELLPTGASTFGASSPGCNGALPISVSSMPQIGNASFSVLCGNAPAGGSGLLGYSVGAFATPLPVLGADLWIDLATVPYLILPAAANGLGVADVALPLPPAQALVGATSYLQFLWLESTSPAPCPPLGLSASNGLKIVIQP